MKTVEQIATEIVAREGGYVNDPDDPGGATNFGVTLATLQRLGIDKTGDGRVDIRDVRGLTRADAERIFVEHYFRKPRLAELPASVQASVFDMYVNAGSNAVKILQKLVTRMGFPAVADGVLGARTILAARQADAAAPGTHSGTLRCTLRRRGRVTCSQINLRCPLICARFTCRRGQVLRQWMCCERRWRWGNLLRWCIRR